MQLSIPALEVACQAVVALGESAELVVAGHVDAAGEVAAGDVIDRRRDGSQGSGQVRRQDQGQQDPEDRRRGDGEQQHARDRLAGAPARSNREQDKPESAQREDRSADQGDREAEPKRQPRADPRSGGSRRLPGPGPGPALGCVHVLLLDHARNATTHESREAGCGPA